MADVPFVNTAFWYFLSTNYLLLIILVMGSTPIVPYVLARWRFGEKTKQTLSFVCILALLIASVAYLVDSAYNPFLYFRF